MQLFLNSLELFLPQSKDSSENSDSDDSDSSSDSSSSDGDKKPRIERSIIEPIIGARSI